MSRLSAMPARATVYKSPQASDCKHHNSFSFPNPYSQNTSQSLTLFLSFQIICAMATLTTPTYPKFQSRQPLQNQKNTGGDMSMVFFTRPRYPRVFTQNDQSQLIKSLNVEMISGIPFPTPEWLSNSSEYSALQANNGGGSNWAYISVNLPMYPATIDPSEWNDMWFSMCGRIHPYALNWECEEIENYDPNEEQVNYTIPTVLVRDQSYQPLVHHSFVCYTKLQSLTNTVALPLGCSTRQTLSRSPPQ